MKWFVFALFVLILTSSIVVADGSQTVQQTQNQSKQGTGKWQEVK